MLVLETKPKRPRDEAKLGTKPKRPMDETNGLETRAKRSRDEVQVLGTKPKSLSMLY